MAYTDHSVIYGRAFSEIYENTPEAQQLIKELENLDSSGIFDQSLCGYSSHDSMDQSYSFGIRLGSLDPWGFTGLSEINLQPNDQQLELYRKELDLFLAALTQTSAKEFLAKPEQVYFVANAN